ncbi:glycosyltransferase family 4 protein [Sphaerisporangium sp. TRM90804]|uniref:glycosyltransferase family 4 protein n=1 Tax=Sphaerisporangium sp. TRM90804 TaxID=3031113 RepID=UPI0024499611|nr:glycosyltransferase family 4 protein [Sphaerisporangium sp. TRM90804]MDH2427904.1 glycosyltransferase family 4 protein [Sphaerisporangium sp. TRM90804]
MNWRDPWHHAAGGAETYAWEIGRRLAAAGARVTFVTARDTGQARRERADGVDIVRMGGVFTVYPLVLAWLALRRRRFDAVVDCQNGIPFFTPWAVRRGVPIVCVMHHVHDDQFGVHFPSWMARAGRFLEGPVARAAYRRHACVAVSPSTVAAMRDRLAWTGPIHVVPNGGDPPREAPSPPSPEPSVVCVGRLVAHKRVERVVELAAALRDRWPGLKVHVIGRGPELDRLERRAAAAGLDGVVRFHGYVDAHEKERLVSSAWVHLSASRGEGWGLSVLEAAALGVPTVAYDVDGLRDAVRDGRTGWLAKPGQALEDVVDAALKETSDPARRAELAAECRAWAARFDWDASATRMARLLMVSRPTPGEAYVVRYRPPSAGAPSDGSPSATAPSAGSPPVPDAGRAAAGVPDAPGVRPAGDGAVRAVVVECATPELIRAAGLGEILEIRPARPEEVLLGSPC